jgi:hypothetical protein
MNIAEAIAYFTALSPEDKASFLARLVHELTMVARDTYEAGTENLTCPARMRAVNEIQHRLTAYLAALLGGDSRRYPDDILVRSVLEQPQDEILERQLAEAFSRIRSREGAAA